jgi:hypothetical protein
MVVNCNCPHAAFVRRARRGFLFNFRDFSSANELAVMPTAEFASFIHQDRDKWSKVIEELGLKQLET